MQYLKELKSQYLKNIKRHDKTVLLAKDKLNIIEVLISKALITHTLLMMNLFQ